MSETLVLIAVSIIIAGFLILAGVALWLATERRRHLQPGSQTVPKAPPAEHPAPRPTPPPAPATPAAVPAQAKKEAAAAPATSSSAPAKEITSSAEYPSARSYDQTWLPDQPRKSKRPKPPNPG